MNYEELDISLRNFWKMHGISEKDLYCRKCGLLMVNLDELNDIEVLASAKRGDVFRHKTNIYEGYTESPQNRWCVKGRTLSGKTYFRHLCWNCLKDEIIYAVKHNDELQLISPSRYLKWKRMLANGKINGYLNKLPPPAWNSPIWWFKLIFDITDDELNVERTKFDTASSQSFVRRYGEDEGKKKYDDYVKLQAKAGCSLDYFVEKFGVEDGTRRYEELCKNKGVSLENCIRKYGKDVGERFFKDYCSVQSYAGVSLQWFIDKYGEEHGKSKYDEVLKKKIAFKHYSVVSQELFKLIDDKLGDFSKESRWECKNHEFEVCTTDENGVKHVYHVDYMLNQKIIEFYGDIWHANPNKYKENDVFTTFTGKNQRVKTIWENDAKRQSYIEKCGFQVYVVWESDYAENPDRVVDECVKFLRDE